MEEPQILPFTESARRVFRTLFRLELEVGSPLPIGDSHPGPAVSASVAITQDLRGSFALSLPLETVRRLSAMLTGSGAAGTTEDLCDAAGELAGLIAGGAAPGFPGISFGVSCPRASLRATVAPIRRADPFMVTIPCACDCGPFTIEIRLSTTAARLAA